jgi:hypothetical protein
MADHDVHGKITSTWSDDDRWTGTQYVPGRRVDVFEDGCVRTTDFEDGNPNAWSTSLPSHSLLPTAGGGAS